MSYLENRILDGSCPNCLGEKTIFNGVQYEVCTLCNGDGTYNELNDDDVYNNIQEEDFIPFDENIHSQYDNTSDDID